MSRTARTTAAVVLAALALTACGSDPVPGDPDYAIPTGGPTPYTAPVGSNDKTPPPAVTPPPSSAPSQDPGPEGDPVYETVKLVMGLGIANAGLLDPEADSREELMAPARATMTPEAQRRYAETLPAPGGAQPTGDGSAWQYAIPVECTPGSERCTTGAPVASTFRFVETGRVDHPDGSVEVWADADVVIEATRTDNGKRETAHVVRHGHYLLVPADADESPHGWLVHEWTGTGTEAITWKAAP